MPNVTPGITVKTKQFTVDDVDPMEPVTADIDCRQIEVWEDVPVSNFKTAAPLSADDKLSHFIGEKVVFIRPSPGKFDMNQYADPGFYTAGDIVGYIATASGAGSRTFNRRCLK